ncbi:hypothetical protein HYD_6620 [Candidatus Hydrogenosomobacter endosymbioticus]|uniref:Uncharacterized protein n=1 Tax=Candidatus Hydrogenosomobacter endosymbioticus TaxID=2558174 RepID=A0ABN6L3J7_9PROT|nr:hypothetical protein HYD_6620 [Candidatus Hydrogenosomobacter endosymbioticus]
MLFQKFDAAADSEEDSFPSNDLKVAPYSLIIFSDTGLSIYKSRVAIIKLINNTGVINCIKEIPIERKATISLCLLNLKTNKRAEKNIMNARV